MSDEAEENKALSPDTSSDDAMPEGIPSPPTPLPPPDDFDSAKEEELERKKNKKREKRQKKGRKHPTDSYKPLKGNNKGCFGCCGCFAGLGFILLLGLGGFAYWLVGSFLAKDYERVQLTEAEAIVTEAPIRKTVYIGNKIVWQVPSTEVPIAILANEVVVDGDFSEDVSLRGAKVNVKGTARFAKDLEVFAGEFHDEGLTLNGELKGKVISSKE